MAGVQGGVAKRPDADALVLAPECAGGAGTHVPHTVGGSASPESPVALAPGAFELLECPAGYTRSPWCSCPAAVEQSG